MSANKILHRQHRQLQLIAEALIVANRSERESLVHELGNRFDAHALVEEKLVFPTFATRTSRSTLDGYAHDHQLARQALAVLIERPMLEGQAEVVRDLMRDHVAHLEQELMPLLDRTLTAWQLEQLGGEIKAMYDALIARHAAEQLWPRE